MTIEAVTPLRKRLLDVGLCLLALLLLWPVMLGLAVVLLVVQGRPVIFRSERMSGPGRAFDLYKFRSMRVATQDHGVTGGDKSDRITPLGAKMRRWRLDELPQIINILRGDMSLVGPRPPARQYVDAFPALYAKVLAVPPGLTGLATLHFHRHEERLLAACQSAEETHAVYARRCVPRKAQLDLMYQRHWSLCLDLKLIWQTVWHVLRD